MSSAAVLERPPVSERPIAPSATQSNPSSEGPAGAKWLEDVYSAVRHERIDAALDLLMEHFDELFHAGKFSEANSLLDHVDLQRLDIDTMVGLLAATLPARDELKRRGRLVERVRVHLQRLAPTRLPGLLQGLD